MSQFIHFQAVDIDLNEEEATEGEEEDSPEGTTINNFTDDASSIGDQSPSFYRGVDNKSVKNLTLTYEDVIALSEYESSTLYGFLNFDQRSVFPREIDESKITEMRISKFKKSLK